MTDRPREFHLAASTEEIGALAEFLRDTSCDDVVVRIEPERPLGALEAQLLLAAVADRAGSARVRVAPDGPRIRSGLRLLGLEGRIEVAL